MPLGRGQVVLRRRHLFADDERRVSDEVWPRLRPAYIPRSWRSAGRVRRDYAEQIPSTACVVSRCLEPVAVLRRPSPNRRRGRRDGAAARSRRTDSVSGLLDCRPAHRPERTTPEGLRRHPPGWPRCLPRSAAGMEAPRRISSTPAWIEETLAAAVSPLRIPGAWHPVFGRSPSKEARVQITRSSIETARGPREWFTGDVFLDPVAAPSGEIAPRRNQRPFHARRPHGLAHAPQRADDLRYRGRRPSPAAGRPGGGDPPRRPGLLRARGGSLARGRSRPLHDPLAMLEVDAEGRAPSGRSM